MIVGIKCLPVQVYDGGETGIRMELAKAGFGAAGYVSVVIRDVEFLGGGGDVEGTNAWMRAPCADSLTPRGAIFFFDDCLAGDDAMTRSQAVLVMGWLKRHIEDKEHKVLVVSCTDGQSRSGAVALVAASGTGIGIAACRRWNPGLRPNPFVVEMLLAANG